MQPQALKAMTAVMSMELVAVLTHIPLVKTLQSIITRRQVGYVV